MCMTKLYRLRRELSAPDDMGASWSRPPERMLPPARTAPDVASVAAVSTTAAKTEPALLVAAAAARRLHALEEEATACRLARYAVAGSGMSAARRLAAAASCPPWLLPLPCPAATAAAGGAPPGFSDSSGLTQLFLLEVLASVPAGYKMLVHVDGLGDFQVTVPAGVLVGASFTFEAEAPIDKQPSDAPIESVPMGLPVQTEQQMPKGIPVPMGAQRLPCPPRLSQSQAGAGTSGVLRTGLARPDLGREAARRMQRQRDREGSRSTSPKGQRDQNTLRSDYELADQLQLDAVIAASLADAPSTRRSLPQPCARRLDYDLDATIAASLTLAIAT